MYQLYLNEAEKILNKKFLNKLKLPAALKYIHVSMNIVHLDHTFLQLII